LDIEAIKRIRAAYFRCIDTKHFGELRGLFTDDARFDNLVVACPDADTFVRAVAERHATTTTVHHGHLPEIELTGPMTARGRWPFFDYLEWPTGEHPPEFPQHRGFRGYGHYEEEYRKDGDDWKISFMRITRVRVDPFGS
jgi:hypothetical protein